MRTDTGTLIHEAFNGLVQRTFPEATLLELYGAGIHWHESGEVSVTCGGKTAIVNLPLMETGNDVDRSAVK